MSSFHDFDIEDFHTRFGFTQPEKPQFLNDEQMAVRLNFQLEELLETAEAAGFVLGYKTVLGDGKEEGAFTFERDLALEPDLAKFLDGQVDQEYVLHGTSWLCKLPHFEAWDMVHEANMKKERVQRASDSTRGTTFDVRKPAGWVAPDVGKLLK